MLITIEENLEEFASMAPEEARASLKQLSFEPFRLVMTDGVSC
jgi:hypothetical protein